MGPLISVIIPVYNRGWCLKRAIASVLGQTYQDIELIVINDGSSDFTGPLAKSYEEVHYLETIGVGVSEARNLGIKHARGEWVAFLDSDDEWLEDKLEKQVRFMENTPDIKVIHGDEIWIRNGVRVNPMKKHQKFGGDIFEKCLPLCVISPSCVMIKKDVFNHVGLFDPKMIVCEDYDLWLRISSLYKVGYIDEYLIKKYGGHDDQLSKQYKGMDYYRVKAIDKILKTRKLNRSLRLKAIDVLNEKTNILINGYKKYKQWDKIPEMESILSKWEEPSVDQEHGTLG